MSDIRELLELAARAMGFDVRGSFEHSDCLGLYIADITLDDDCDAGAHIKWRPLFYRSTDAYDMCAALGIATTWTDILVCTELRGNLVSEYFRDHNNDRSTAWRMAALRVAAEIGRAKG